MSLSDPGSAERTAQKRKFPSPPHSSNGHSPQDSSTSPIKKKKKPGLLNSSNKEQVKESLLSSFRSGGMEIGGSSIAWVLSLGVACCRVHKEQLRGGLLQEISAGFRSVLRTKDRAESQVGWGVGAA